MPSEDRQPMTPSEFDDTCRTLERRCPWLWTTSGYRSAERNERVGGHPDSKHVVGMARDYVAASVEKMHDAASVARSLGLWVVVHDAGSGDHIHTQGLPPGPIPAWWRDKYLAGG